MFELLAVVSVEVTGSEGPMACPQQSYRTLTDDVSCYSVYTSWSIHNLSHGVEVSSS